MSDDLPIHARAVADVDPSSWPQTITQSMGYDYTSPDGNTTVTGSATFSWNKVTLADKLSKPSPFVYLYDPNEIWLQPATSYDDAGDPVADPTPPTDKICIMRGEYLPVRGAVGKMPGWKVLFGEQDPVKAAFTTTVRHPGHTPPWPDDVSHQDANASVSMTCGVVAPGRTKFQGVPVDDPSGEPYRAYRTTFVGFSDGAFPGGSASGYDDTYTVDLLVTAQAAANGAAPVMPVYRITFPEQARFFKCTCTIIVDGQSYVITDGSEPLIYIDGLMSEWLLVAGTVYQRGINIYDVEVREAGAVVAAGTLTQWGSIASGRSFINTKVIDDPFNLPGQTFDFSFPESGYTETVTF